MSCSSAPMCLRTRRVPTQLCSDPEILSWTARLCPRPPCRPPHLLSAAASPGTDAADGTAATGTPSTIGKCASPDGSTTAPSTRPPNGADRRPRGGASSRVQTGGAATGVRGRLRRAHVRRSKTRTGRRIFVTSGTRRTPASDATPGASVAEQKTMHNFRAQQHLVCQGRRAIGEGGGGRCWCYNYIFVATTALILRFVVYKKLA
mmetsp:Transcript_48990/g.95794  ORF Transcript_48990/g.95794 Transcript_48990/m.95794 type:complete len:205 (-) Transcript_48990:9-623(-)